MQSIAPRLFVHPMDLIKIFDESISESTAFRWYSGLKKTLKKQRHQYLTVKEVADWWDIPEESIQKKLNP